MKNLNYRVLTTILAGLRRLQDDVSRYGIVGIAEHYPHFINAEPLSNTDIDELCEDIYSGCFCTHNNSKNNDQRKRFDELECFVKSIATLDKPEDFEERGSVMSNDDAVDTVDRLISEARDMVPSDIWATPMPS